MFERELRWVRVDIEASYKEANEMGGVCNNIRCVTPDELARVKMTLEDEWNSKLRTMLKMDSDVNYHLPLVISFLYVANYDKVLSKVAADMVVAGWTPMPISTIAQISSLTGDPSGEPVDAP